jgi:hypothetical protein
MSDFVPALPIALKWNVGENRFDSDGKNPLALSVFVPADSAFALAQYILNCAEEPSLRKSSKVWDYKNKCEVEVDGFYINGKGREGRDGSSYGNVNPKFVGATEEEAPF